MPTQPNLLFIFADQHRHDAMGCAGNPLRRPISIDWPRQAWLPNLKRQNNHGKARTEEHAR